MSSSSVSNDHNQGLLDLLQAHGEQFLNNFDLPKSNSKKRKHLDEDTPPENSNTPTHFGSESEEEWGGIVTDMGDEEVDASDGEVQNFKHGDDESTADTTTFSPSPNVVVFSGYSSKRETPALSNKSLRKSFMSSKVSKISQEVLGPPQAKRQSLDSTDDDVSNSQNDALLYKLVHTKLLSGSLNPELDMSPAERRKALSGRVRELAGQSSLGKGERAVKDAERNQASRHVREGLKNKQKEREKKQLEEAKDLGTYHPTLKKLFEPTTSTDAKPRKREKGLKMGVGTFSGGVLKLGRDDINMINGSRGRGRGRGRGHGRGRGKGRP